MSSIHLQDAHPDESPAKRARWELAQQSGGCYYHPTESVEESQQNFSDVLRYPWSNELFQHAWQPQEACAPASAALPVELEESITPAQDQASGQDPDEGSHHDRKEHAENSQQHDLEVPFEPWSNGPVRGSTNKSHSNALHEGFSAESSFFTTPVDPEPPAPVPRPAGFVDVTQPDTKTQEQATSAAEQELVCFGMVGSVSSPGR